MPTAPYDFLETVVNTARVRLNDAIASIGGDVMTDGRDFTLVAVNAAWRRLQDQLANSGLQTLDRETVLANVPASTSADQGVRVWFNWVNYFDGTNLQSAPVLPQDLIMPLDLSERVHGSTANYTPVDQVFGGLPTAPKQTLNRLWEWRQETIYMPGSTGATDILLRYAGYLADFVAPGTTAWNVQPVKIMRSLNSFAWYICSEMARGRGDLDAGWFDSAAAEAAQEIFNRDYRQGKVLYKRSETGKMTDPNSRTNGPAGPRGPEKAQ